MPNTGMWCCLFSRTLIFGAERITKRTRCLPLADWLRGEDFYGATISNAQEHIHLPGAGKYIVLLGAFITQVGSLLFSLPELMGQKQSKLFVYHQHGLLKRLLKSRNSGSEFLCVGGGGRTLLNYALRETQPFARLQILGHAHVTNRSLAITRLLS